MVSSGRSMRGRVGFERSGSAWELLVRDNVIANDISLTNQVSIDV
jgi:hypothetical protein